MKPYLQLARPLPAEHPTSREFMERKLSDSGLVPEDLGAYPIAPTSLSHIPGFLIPYHDPNMYRIRYDRLTDKYIGPKGKLGVWWSPTQDLDTYRHSPEIYIVEGELKAASLQKRFPHLKVLGIGGAWMFAVKDNGIAHLLPEILKAVAPNQVVNVIFDGDIQEKLGIQQAAHSINSLLDATRCTTRIFKAPIGKGVDDWLVADPVAKLSDLINIPMDTLEVSRKNLYKKLQCSLNDKGKLVLNVLNGTRLLQDHFDGNTYLDKRLGVISNGERQQDDEALFRLSLEYLQGEIHYNYGPSTIRMASEMALANSEIDLVQDLVKKLEWDGVPRLNTWGSEYLETTWPGYANEWGRLLITGLALRIMRPGTKADYCCIMTGAQGIGKTTFFEELSHFGGFNFYTAMTELVTNGGDVDRTQVIKFKKSIIVDLAEGVVFNSRKSNTDAMKQLISQSEDEFRNLYRSGITLVPRGFVFVGTTNRMDQMSDATGSRRFLNMEVTKIKRMDYEYKLQLLAEVVANEQEIRQSPWYELKLTAADAPEAMREDHEHIKSAQELVNASHYKFDSITAYITDLVDSGNACMAGATRGYPARPFLTPLFVARKMGDDSVRAQNMAARMLGQLVSSPAYKYKVEVYRPRVPSLTFKDVSQQKEYLNDDTRPERMVNGYAFQRK